MIRGRKLNAESNFRKHNIPIGAKQYPSLVEMAVNIFSVVLLSFY